MDTIQLFKYSILTKMITETSNSLFTSSGYTVYFGMLLASLFLLYQCIHPLISDDINECVVISAKDYIKYIFPTYAKDESCINIPTHKKIYYSTNSHVVKETVKTIYSLRFRALNYFLQEKFNSISNLVEIIKIENDKWGYETSSDYILFPLNNSKVQIDIEQNIWFEVEITSAKLEEPNDTKQKTNYTKMSEKNYIFKLTTPGKGNSKKLIAFLDTIIELYTKNVINKKDKIIIEYVQSQKDDDDKMKLTYKEYPFESNKFLDKNIFLEEKDQLIQYIDQFSIYNPNNSSYAEYATSGLTHKSTILLSGPPGTGKSCTIRGILNRTGRIGILVQWSKIKTCSEFISLIRNLQINGKTYTLGELCFIFEDFGANGCKVLKSRKSSIHKISNDFFNIAELEMNTKLDEDINKIENLELKNSIYNQLQSYKTKISQLYINKTIDDALTLDCVLNAIDGIVELHDAMIIFTDNHIEDLDDAFLRPGRINYKLKLKNASVSIIKDMIQVKFGLLDEIMAEYSEQFNAMQNYIISPADVQNICFTYTNNEIRQCLDEIIQRTNV